MAVRRVGGKTTGLILEPLRHVSQVANSLGLGFAGAAVALVLLDVDEAQKVKSR
jgi:hypothetical protein